MSENTINENVSGAEDGDALERRFPRRFLLTAAGAAAAFGLAEAMAPDAQAAAGTTPWVLGGNTGVATDGTNFLGTKNVADLIIKTAATAGTPLERMRVTKAGSVGIGTTAPSARLDVRGLLNTIRAVNTNTTNTASAVQASATKGIGVNATSTDGYGVKADCTNNVGVLGNGGYIGVNGTGASYGGVFSSTNATSTGAYASGAGYGVIGYGGTYGVYGSGPDGVHGSGSTNGVYGTGNTNGVYGTGNTGVSGHGGAIGVFGGDANNSGVRGDSTYVGVWGSGTSWGIYGEATGTTGQNYGVYGQADSPQGFALFASGNAHVNGTLSKTAGSFKIDHPLDPENKWLSHSFVESPDMMNVYNGNVALDAHGKATVRLPHYFAALNRDYRYQLTTIGGHAPVYIESEVKDNAFTIAGGTAGLKVSWQVTGIRQDDYARHHPIVVETDKAKDQRGMREFVPAGSTAQRMHVGPARVELPKAVTRSHAAPIAPR